MDAHCSAATHLVPSCARPILLTKTKVHFPEVAPLSVLVCEGLPASFGVQGRLTGGGTCSLRRWLARALASQHYALTRRLGMLIPLRNVLAGTLVCQPTERSSSRGGQLGASCSPAVSCISAQGANCLQFRSQACWGHGPAAWNPYTRLPRDPGLTTNTALQAGAGGVGAMAVKERVPVLRLARHGRVCGGCEFLPAPTTHPSDSSLRQRRNLNLNPRSLACDTSGPSQGILLQNAAPSAIGQHRRPAAPP